MFLMDLTSFIPGKQDAALGSKLGIYFTRPTRLTRNINVAFVLKKNGLPVTDKYNYEYQIGLIRKKQVAFCVFCGCFKRVTGALTSSR